MTTTPQLIDSLVGNAAPVRRLRHPLLRTALWLLFAVLILALLAIGHGVRSDLDQRLQQPMFVVGIAAALLTGVLAAVAAFHASLLDRSRYWLLLPLPALVVWLSTISYGCLTDWVELRAGDVRWGETARCFATLVLTSAPLSLLLLVMLRHAALWRPMAVGASGSLAVAALAASALALLHDLDATVMILVWNVGVAGLLVGLGSAFARRMFAWVAPTSRFDCGSF